MATERAHDCFGCGRERILRCARCQGCGSKFWRCQKCWTLFTYCSDACRKMTHERKWIVRDLNRLLKMKPLKGELFGGTEEG